MSTTARGNYRFIDNATSSNANSYGNYLLKRGAGEIRRPSWNRTDTVIRLIPYWNGSSWEPYRYSPAPVDLGDWIRRYDVVKGFGEKGISMLLFDPTVEPTYDRQSNPCVILYNAIKQSITKKQCEADWPALLNSEPGRRALLSLPAPIYITRAAIFRIKSKDMATAERSPLGLAASDPCYFFELPKSAGEKLVSMLEDKVEGYTGDPYDYASAYKYGDVVSLDSGAFITIFQEGADPRTSQIVNEQPRQLTVGSAQRSSGGSDKKFIGYDLYITPTWNGYSASLGTPEFETLLREKQRSWADSLQFFSHQEQALLVQDGFPARAILYAWRDHPEWIKEETRSRAVERTSVSMDTRVTYPTDKDPFRNSEGAVVSPSTEPTQRAKSPPVKVGGWGTTPSEDEEIMPTAASVVVPPEVPEKPAEVPEKPTVTDSRARAALDSARARAAGRQQK